MSKFFDRSISSDSEEEEVENEQRPMPRTAR